MGTGFMLFFSMLKPAEKYLSEIKYKAITKSNTKNLKATISKTLNIKRGLFRKKAAKDSIDNQIETAIEEIKHSPEKTIINELMTKGASKSKFVNYGAQTNKMPIEKKLPFKNLYKAFFSYAKSGYKIIKKPKNFDLNPEQVGYEFDTYSKRFKLIRAPKDHGKTWLHF